MAVAEGCIGAGRLLTLEGKETLERSLGKRRVFILALLCPTLCFLSVYAAHSKGFALSMIGSPFSQSFFSNTRWTTPAITCHAAPGYSNC